MPPEQAAEIQGVVVTHRKGNFGDVHGGGTHQVFGSFQPQTGLVGVGRKTGEPLELVDKMAGAHTAGTGQFFHRDFLIQVGVNVFNDLVEVFLVPGPQLDAGDRSHSARLTVFTVIDPCACSPHFCTRTVKGELLKEVFGLICLITLYFVNLII